MSDAAIIRFATLDQNTALCHECCHEFWQHATVQKMRGPLGFGDHKPIPNRCKLLWSKATVVSVAVKP